MKFAITFLLFASACAPAASFGQSPAAPDNTQSNSVPANSAMKASIADGQSNSASDLKLTQRIRKSVMADKTLSTNAHNVKIVTVNGAVTLNGVVKNEHEKSVIQKKASRIAGTGNVTNDLTLTSGE